MGTILIPEDDLFILHRVSRVGSSVHFVSGEGVLQTQKAASQNIP